jgi:AraC-like DNA-binding protein
VLIEKLFDNLALTVNAFAICRVADGWRLRLPEFGFVSLHFAIQGTGGIRDASGDVHVLPQDSLAIVPAGLAHSIECGRGVLAENTPGDRTVHDMPDHIAGEIDKVRLIVACGQIRAVYSAGLGLFEHLSEVIVLDFSEEPTMRPTFQALLREQQTATPGAQAMMGSLMTQCLVLVFRRLCDHGTCTLPWLAALEDERMSRVLDAILTRPEQQHTLESLAEVAIMSRAAFAKQFRASFGRPPMEYVREVRLRRAAQLLRSQSHLSIEAAAHRVGIASRSQFSKAFRDHFGVSPKDFRTQ